MNKPNYHVKSVPRMFEQIAKQIVDYIESEQFEKGEKLPTERQLCDLLQVSRSSVREGIRVLELLKYLDSRQGGGTFVSEPPPYILPMQVIDKNTDQKTLDDYFDILQMVTDKIISLTIKSHNITVIIDADKHKENNNFWYSFYELFRHLSTQLENPYYFSLWSDTFRFLNKNGFFENKAVTVSINDLYADLAAKSDEKIKKLFKELNN